MSKEKQCECCHEWWYGSDVKEDLCPNCYYYFKQLKQQLAEKEKENEELKQQNIALENENSKLATELIVDKYQKAQKRVSFGIQLAIAELEKVKDWLNEPFDEDGCFKIGGDLIDFIDQQIKLLKGEKDAEN